MTELTQEQIQIATELRGQGYRGQPLSWRNVAKQIGVPHYSVLKHFDPEQLAAKRVREKKHREKFQHNVKMYGLGVSRVEVPDDVLAERDRAALAEPETITAALMGDPPPGRSALARKLSPQVRL